MTPPSERRAPGAGSMIAGRYVLAEPIASGGMAQVWLGRDNQLNRAVAIKVMHEHLRGDSASVERFRREAQASANLIHPNIVAIYDTVSEPDVDAIVMEVVDGETLRAHLDHHGPLAEPLLRQVGAELASALDCAHSHGVVHRDIKPANIVVTPSGSTRLLDFGIAKAHEDPDLTVAGTLIGTAAYLAPEQVGTGLIDQRTDLYALSCVLYEAACGSPPFRGDSPTATALARLHQDPEPLSSRTRALSGSTCDAIMRNLERAPERRFQAARDFGAALLATAPPTPLRADANVATRTTSKTGPSTQATHPATRPATREVSAPKPKPKRPRRSRVGRAMLSLLVLGPIGLVIALLIRDSETPGVPQPRVRTSSVAIAGAVPFDPFGRGDAGENNNLAELAIDGDPTTAWRTETYNDQRFGTKPGVGLVIELGARHSLDELRLQTSVGWSGDIVVGESDLATASGAPAKGRPITATEASTVVDLSGSAGSSILIWITDLGPSADRHRVDVFDVEVTARELVK